MERFRTRFTHTPRCHFPRSGTPSSGVAVAATSSGLCLCPRSNRSTTEVGRQGGLPVNRLDVTESGLGSTSLSPDVSDGYTRVTTCSRLGILFRGQEVVVIVTPERTTSGHLIRAQSGATMGRKNHDRVR